MRDAAPACSRCGGFAVELEVFPLTACTGCGGSGRTAAPPPGFLAPATPSSPAAAGGAVHEAPAAPRN